MNLLHTLLLSVLAAFQGADDVPPAAGPAADPTPPAAEAPAQGPTLPEPAAEDPVTLRGLEILERAASYQRGDLASVQPTGLYGRFFVTIRTDQGRTTAKSERWFMPDPQRMLAVIEPSLGSESVTEGWDQGTAWMQDSRGGLYVYSDAPDNYQADLERLEELARLHDLFLDAAVLDALIPDLEQVRFAGEGEHRDLDGVPHPIEFVQAFLEDTLWVEPAPDAPILLLPGEEAPQDDAPPPRLELRFAVDAETGALWGLRVVPVGRPEVPELDLRFDYHGTTRAGLRVPGNIVVKQSVDGGRFTELLKLGIAIEDDGHLAFAVDVDLPAERFAPPR